MLGRGTARANTHLANQHTRRYWNSRHPKYTTIGLEVNYMNNPSVRIPNHSWNPIIYLGQGPYRGQSMAMQICNCFAKVHNSTQPNTHNEMRIGLGMNGIIKYMP